MKKYGFMNLLEALDPRYPVPGRTALSKELNCVLIEFKAKKVLMKSAFAVMHGRIKALLLTWGYWAFFI